MDKEKYVIVVVCEADLPWSTADNPVQAPEDVLAGSNCEAGFRCWKELRQLEEGKKVSFVLYTSRDDIELPKEIAEDPTTRFVAKDPNDDFVIKNAILDVTN